MRFVIALCLCFAGGIAQAGGITGCTKSDTRDVRAALDAAKELTLRAAAVVGDTSDYDRWFGTYSAANAEQVRQTLKSVVTAIRSGAVTVQCHDVGGGYCTDGEYAFVYPIEAYHLHLCPSFFSLPTLDVLAPGTRRGDYGTREGTIVHELSHFVVVADTEDHCYSRSECAQMADSDARRAIENADSFQYFTEDVTYYARQPVVGKTLPATD